MALWTFTKVSEILECSPQNVYQKKAKLKKMGYIEIDPNDNKEKINENGYNYLLNLRKNTMQNIPNNLNNTCLEETENIDNSNSLNFKQDQIIVDFLKNQVEELKNQVKEEKEQKQYWQNLYIQQSEDFKKLAFPPMLDTEEGNKQTEEATKRGFWKRIFG